VTSSETFDVDCSTPPHVSLVWAVIHEPTSTSHGTELTHHGKLAPRSKVNDARAQEIDQLVVHCDDCLDARLDGGLETGVKFTRIPHRDGLEPETQHRTCRLHFLQLQAVAGVVSMPEYG
jgi:hypothetical protein